MDVRSFGARMDGTTNDAAALQKAIDTVVARGGGVVLIPQGNLLLTIRDKSAITLRLGVTLRGAGAGKTTLLAPAAGADYDGIMMELPEFVTARLESLTLRGPSETFDDHTTQGILHHGGLAGIQIRDVRIISFTECIKAHGSASVEATACEFAEAEQGILHVGSGSVFATDCLFRDTHVQPVKLPPGHDHGIYAYQGVRVVAERSAFRRITGYGIHLWGGSGAPQAVSVNACEFDSCALAGVLGNNAAGSVTEIRNSKFKGGGDGVHPQSGRVEVSSCSFDVGRYAVRQEPGLGGDGEGGLLLKNCTVHSSGDNFGIYMGTGGAWIIRSCLFTGNGSAAIGKYDSTGTMTISDSRFVGAYTKAALDLRGAVTTVSACLLAGSTPYAILATGYRSGVPTIVQCNGDTISATEHGIYLWPDKAQVELYGSDNLFLAGTPLRGGPSSTSATSVIQLKNRQGEGSPILSSAVIRLNWNYDTFRVSGGQTVETILMPGIFDTGNFGIVRATLIVDGPWSLSSRGNILPLSALPRVLHDRVEIAFDGAAGKWREVNPETSR